MNTPRKHLTRRQTAVRRPAEPMTRTRSGRPAARSHPHSDLPVRGDGTRTLTRLVLPSVAGRPRGHVVAPAVGAPMPQSLTARLQGHVAAHAIGEPIPHSFDGRPHGRVAAHAIGEPMPQSFDGRPHGHVAGHKAVDSRFTAETDTHGNR